MYVFNLLWSVFKGCFITFERTLYNCTVPFLPFRMLCYIVAIHFTFQFHDTLLFCSNVCVFDRIQLCDPIDCSLPRSTIYEILQVRVMECIAFPFPPDPGIEPTSLSSSTLLGGFFTSSATWVDPTIHARRKT